MPQISSAVGRYGTNQKSDVAVVQAAFLQLTSRFPEAGELWVDGRPSHALEEVIEGFQEKEGLPVTGRLEATGPGLRILSALMPGTLGGLRAVPETAAVFADPQGRFGTGAAANFDHAILPNREAAALGLSAGHIRRELTLSLVLEKQSIDHRGRFHNEMSFGRLLWFNSQGRFSAGDPPQEVLRRATGHLSLADIEPTVSPSVGLTVASRDPIKALRDAPQTVDADLIAKHGLILPTDPIKNRIVNAAVHVAELGDPDGDLPRLADIQNGPRIPEPTQDGITAESTLGDRPVWPTRYGQITDGFYREPRKRPGSSTPRRHTAVDIRNPLGEPVFAVLSGKVIVISSASGSGNYLKVAHENGMETSYSHTRSSVSVGDTVDKGDTIGYSDGSGFGSGPHLHFVLRINGERGDPMRNLLDLADRP